MQVQRQGRVEKQYPRTYQMDASTRRFYRGMAIVLVALAVVPLLHLTGTVGPRSPLALAVIEVAFLAIPVWISFVTSRRVILYEDAIEVAGWLSTARLRRDEILGRRMSRGYRGGSYYIVVPHDRGARELKLPPFLHTDELFRAWMKNVPQLKK
jgi:hypothetical protein